MSILGNPAAKPGSALQSLPPFLRIHVGEPFLVCGCGPSLNELPDPQRHLTIGVNDVGRLFDPTYLVVVNPRSQFKGDRFRYVQESNARALFTQLDLGRVRPPVVRFRLGKYGGTDVGAADVLHYTQNSPYVAVCLAAYMGAARIGLIGVDMTDHHFFAQTGRHPLAGRLREIDEQYGRLAAALAERGVELVNLSSISRLTSLPRCGASQFAEAESDEPTSMESSRGLRIVSYATTPVAGVPAILARSIAHTTEHSARCVWATADYGNGVRFTGDVEWSRAPAEAMQLLEQADLVIVHNGKVAPPHRRLLATKPVITMAHNYGWNVDMQFVERGWPGVVVGQYQATLPEFAGWAVVPNPIPLWEPGYTPGPKGDRLTIAFTPSGQHECYPHSHRLYWHAKGFKTTMAVLERLARRWSLDLQTTAPRQVSLDEALAMKRRAHLVIDECVTGSYHRNSLEGLAAGCIVINGLGLVPAIADAFRECAPNSSSLPFICCGLDDLERTLAALVEQGPGKLVEAGRANRAWMQAHWDFATQWERFWLPLVGTALERREAAGCPRGTATRPHTAIPPGAEPGHRGPRSLPESNDRTRAEFAAITPTSRIPTMVSIVVPHGGPDRLPLLTASLGSLRQCQGVGEIIVSEMGSEPVAGEVARDLADKHIFVRNDGPFERARSINVGLGVSEFDLVLWADNDLLYPPDFVAGAADELQERSLDYLIPFSSIGYLSEGDTHAVLAGVRVAADCTPVNVLYSGHRGPNPAGGTIGVVRRAFLARYGGFIEGFRGWGGEDNAWNWKAQLLGRLAATLYSDRHVHHLYHPNSGGYQQGRPGEENPYYAENVALMRRVFAVRNAKQFLHRFPPPTHWSCPWSTERRIVFLIDEATPGWAMLAREVRQAMQASYGLKVEVVAGPAALGYREIFAAADAVVTFGANAACVVLDGGAPEAARKLIAVTGGAESLNPILDRLQGSVGLHLEPADTDPAVAERLAVRLVPSLSLVLAGNGGSTAPAALRAASASGTQPGSETIPVWLYWEGPYPDWIRACHHTIAAHAPGVRLLTPESFDALRDQDRDIDLQRLHVAHRADFVRAFLLARYGGLWIDSDCLVLRSLQPILELIEEHGFVGHRERSGIISNGFMGARREYPIAMALYQRICRTLRSRRRLGWTTLGSDLLTEIVASGSVLWYELPCERIQPICWSDPGAFFATGDPRTHERVVDPDAFCYMLSNTEVTRYQATVPRGLLDPDSFFTYLVERSLADAAGDATRKHALPAGAVHAATAQVPYEQIFRGMSDVYRRFGDESLSGPGSSLGQTEAIRAQLPPLLRELGVRSLLDAPCGDFNWMKAVAFEVEEYVGVDILFDQIEQNRQRYGGPSRCFLRLDILRDELPAADCILCRDCLVHLSFEDVFRALCNFKRSGARYLVMTTFTAHRPNQDTTLGRWRPLNFELAPFNLPAPRRLINERCSETGGIYADKCLGLWGFADLLV